MLKSVNLGDDADTVGTITRKLAGACYGIDNISDELVGGLSKSEEISVIVERMIEVGSGILLGSILGREHE